jgi:DNA-binding protein YbaB
VFDGRDLDAAEQMVDEWQDGFEQRAAQAREMATRITGMTASARGGDGTVAVTVGQSGEVLDLRLEEDIRRQPASRTARDILATIAAARNVLAGKVTEVVAETVGADSSTGRAVLAGFPRTDSTDV